jgi:hypothetical protein
MMERDTPAAGMQPQHLIRNASSRNQPAFSRSDLLFYLLMTLWQCCMQQYHPRRDMSGMCRDE